jgi:hypothetical protein
MTAKIQVPCRALRTVPAANYLGVSASLLRKFRMRAPGDPQDRGPDYIKLSPYLVLYEISALDAWLDARREAGRGKANRGTPERRDAAA